MKRVILIFLYFVFNVSAIDSNWWKHTEIYETFVWSYKDSNNDGFGDFKGLRSKLDYLKELGIRTIKLSPIFPSPNEISSSYGASDFKSVHSTLGTMEDFEEFMKTAKSKGIKVILDIILSHCHLSHEWFKKSVEKIAPYTDYFLWEEPMKTKEGDRPPNRWKNSLRNSAWKRNQKRNQYYYSYYNHFLPNLNLKNQFMIKEIEDILNFWMHKGISGFNLLSEKALINVHDDHPHYEKEIVDFILELKQIVEKFNKNVKDYERILMVAADRDLKVSEKLAGNKDHPGANLLSRTINFQNTRTMEYSFQNTPNVFISSLTSKNTFNNEGMHYEWISETNDDQRFSNTQISDVLTLIYFTFPGTVRIHYGQEIGMNEYKTPPVRKINEKLDFQNLHSLPMQWDGSVSGGFTRSKTPIQLPNPNYRTINVEKQKNEQFSKYNMVKNLLKIRRKKTFKFGDIKIQAFSDFVFAITRTYRRHETYLIITNLDNISQEINLSQTVKQLPRSISVIVSTPNAFQQRGNAINTTLPLLLRPMSSIVMVIWTND